MKRNLICHDPGRNSHKFWKVHVDGNLEHRHWGRVGTDGQTKTWPHGTNSAALESAYAKINEKLSEGYVDAPSTGSTPTSAPAPTTSSAPATLRPMLADEVDAATALPRYAANDGYIFEPKLDGDRVMIQVEGGKVTAIGRNGQVSKHNPRFQDRRHVADIAKLAKMGTVVLDGELVGDKLWIFDMPDLVWRGGIEMIFDADEAWHIRRRALGLLFRAWSPNPDLFGLVAYADDEEGKLAMAKDLLDRNCEGVIIKNADAPYRWGRKGPDCLKAKFWKSADVIVSAVGVGGKNSAALSVWRDGKEVPVGHCSLNGKPNVTVGMVIEVDYLYLGPGERLVQTDMKRIRHDKSGPECLFDQLVRTNKTVVA